MAWVHAGLWSDSLASQFGGQYTGGAVTVLVHGTTTLATLYSDRTKAATVANPTHTDALGNLLIYAEPGLYDLATPGSEGAAFFTLAITPDQADLTGSGSTGVSSVFTRSGDVVAQTGDYTAAQVGADLAGSASAALVAAESYTDGQVAGRVPTGRQIISGTGLTGGGALTADRTLAVSYGTAAGTAAQGNDSRIVGAAPAASPTLTGTVTYSGRAVETLHDLGNSGTGTVTPDATTGNAFKITATGNFTLAAPTGGVAGAVQKVLVEIVQDGTGGRTLTLSGIDLGTFTAPVLSTGAGKKDLLGLIWDGTAWLLAAYQPGY